MEDKVILNSIVKWWEKKRLAFNIIVGLVGILTILNIDNAKFTTTETFLSIRWVFGANIFFSIGILLEILNIYYLKNNLINNNARWFFFITGIITSCIITFVSILDYYNPLIIE